ncbi:hypothetical protein ABZ726_38340, partial [Streptomyces hundungensis]
MTTTVGEQTGTDEPEVAAVGDPFDRDELPAPAGATGALLRSLLRPLRRRVVLATLMLVVQQAAAQAGPLLVAYAIDRGVPAFRAHDYRPRGPRPARDGPGRG